MVFGRKELFKRFVENCQSRRLVLFGAGNHAKWLVSNYFCHGEIYSIWDNNSEKIGKYIYGYKVEEPPVELDKEEKESYVVLVAVVDERAILEISRQLKMLGILFYYPSAVMDMSNTIERYNADFSKKFHEQNTYEIVKNHEKEIAMVRELLSDEKSRAVYDAIVEKTMYNIGDYSEICDDIYDHYFSNEFFTYGDHEVFVDGGAFLGEDTFRLADAIGKDRIKRVYCFEPDTANYIRCIKNLNKYFGRCTGTEMEDGYTYTAGKFTALRAGMWNENSQIGFVSYGTHASVFSQLRNAISEEQVTALKLDDVVSADDKVTLIKMDIEGAEIPALQGGSKIIKRDKPKLAICIYHMIEDLWRIPLLIHELVPEYKLYVRHHTPQFWDSVVYAQLEEF